MAGRDRVKDAEDCKLKGNEALKAKDFDKAIEWYSEALKLHSDHVYFSNRSAAYLSKGFAETALKDAEDCIKLNPTWPKGYNRKGAALHKMKRYDDAIAVYEEGLKLDPNDAALQKALQAVKNAKNGPPEGAAAASLFGPDFRDKIKASPNLSKYLEDPSFVQMLDMIETNPQMLQIAAQDPRIQEVFSELLGIKFQTREDMEESEREKELKREEEGRARKQKEEEEKKRKAEEEERIRRENETPEEREKREMKEKAVEIKNAGNELYKKKEFDDALVKYNEARELDPENMMLLLNIASVKLEQGNLEECVSVCKDAIELGRSTSAPFESIAKAYDRIGNAYAKNKMWEKALKAYGSSQLESKSPAVANKIRVVEKNMKEEAAKSYIDPEKAAAAKELGNEKFKAGDFPAAIDHYSEAIKRDPSCAVYYGNRATAFMKLADFGRAMEDCNKALEIDPKYVKCIAKKGNIQVLLKEYHKAIKTFQKGLELDPTNQECLQGLHRTQTAIATSSATEDKERAARAMEDPEIRSIMSDPVMQQVLQDMSSDPNAVKKHMSNPGIREKVETLIAAGVLKTG